MSCLTEERVFAAGAGPRMGPGPQAGQQELLRLLASLRLIPLDGPQPELLGPQRI
jgi:hypothetical protein